MAMLAGPRRKQKVINLRAKNSEWSNDTNKFGQRMLEKMGWSSGKGLGAKENGMVEHVVARYKNDEKGLGFEDKNDQWTKHEDDFNALLANLSNGDKKEEKLHSGVSLEDKSKKSKARVHYHKFTRGKDLTRYSEKDLANIFGKKSFKNEVKVEELLNEDIITEKIFTEKGSMEDYFKSKLAAMKSKTNISLNYDNEKEDYEADYSFQGFSGTANEDTELETQDVGLQGFQFDSASVNDDSNGQSNDIIDESTKKNKKKKKTKKNLKEDLNGETKSSMNYNNEKEDYEADYSFRGFSGMANKDTELERQDVVLQGFSFNSASVKDSNGQSNDILNESIKKNKKKKKSKKSLEDINRETGSLVNDHNENSQINYVENMVEEVLEPVRKKKSKKKIESVPEEVETYKIEKFKIKTSPPRESVEDTIEEDYHVPKKKKKRKNKDNKL